MNFWSTALIRLGLLLTVLGFGPTLLVLLFPAMDALIPLFLAATLGPLGLLILLSGAATWLIGRYRSRG